MRKSTEDDDADKYPNENHEYVKVIHSIYSIPCIYAGYSPYSAK